jgi:hypothetical protein
MRTEIPAGDLVVACDHASGYSDPRLLYRADRLGWSVAIPDLDSVRVRRLQSEGARWVAVVTSPEHPELRAPAFLEPARTADGPLLHDGLTLGRLEVFELSRLPAK